MAPMRSPGPAERATLGEEHELLRASVRDFVAREIAPHVGAWERAGEVPRAVHEKAGAAGLLGIGFPEDVGGSGGDLFHTMVLVEEIDPGRRLLGGLRGAADARHRTAAHPGRGRSRARAPLGPPTLAGRAIGALAVTEPDTGSDVARIRTRAVRDGDSYVVSGAKTFITSGARADFFTTLVRTGGPGAAGLTLLVVEQRHARLPRSAASSRRSAGGAPTRWSCRSKTRACPSRTGWVKKAPASRG